MKRSLIFAACAGLLPALAAAQPQPERMDDPPMPAGPLLTGPAANPESPAGFVSVQVNTDADGNDILLDAANETSIAIDPTAPNRMAIGWRQFDSIESNFRQAGNAWTNDGGRTWHSSGVIEPGVFRTDPVLESDADGTFYYNSLRTDQGYYCEIFHSEDGGQSWVGKTYAYGGDKAWMAVDKSAGIGQHNIYQAWNTNRFNRSVDDGASWSPGMSLAIGWYGTVAVGPSGEVYATGNSQRVARSDNAQDPGAELAFTVVQANLGGSTSYGGGPNPGGLLGQVWVDVDHSDGPTKGYVYLMATVNPPDNDPRDAMITRSTDGGLTWDPPVKINDEAPGTNAWQWFGTMSVAPNGRIDAVWNDTVTAQDDTSELRYSSSEDAGQTWSPSVALGPVWYSKIGWPNQSKIGDYYDMQSDLVGVDLAYAATYTGGQDVYYLRIGDYDCNGNGVGDPQDLANGAAQDCDGDGIPDSCEIAAGAEFDGNGDGVPDSCQCYADFNFDGAVDLFDFLNFINQFDIENPRTDCDHDGEFLLFDFLCFVNAFNDGC